MASGSAGPFENDGAADFLAECEGAPARTVKKALAAVAKPARQTYLEIDAGSAAWAASELVALSFGFGEPSELDDAVLELVAKLRPKEDLRILAMQALERIGERLSSELASLWHEGQDGPKFDAALVELRARLEAASAGARVLPKPKAGDVFTLSAEPEARGVIVLQSLGAGELAVFEGACADASSALTWLSERPAKRIATPLGRLLRRASKQGNAALRVDLRGRQLYAFEFGAVEGYFMGSASGGATRSAGYEEARACAPLDYYDEQAVRALALGLRALKTLRSPDQREADLRASKAAPWNTRREGTTPSPFGDLQSLARLLSWIEQYGVEHAVARFQDQVEGRIGYGRPNEESERRPYAFAGIVALWSGGWSADLWPQALSERLPSCTDEELIARALVVARVLAAEVITRESELRLIWSDTPEHNAELERWVSSLQRALASTFPPSKSTLRLP